MGYNVQLRDYDNLVRLASGGSSTVYRALDARHGRDVAVKVLNQTIDEDATRQRFTNEIASLTVFGDHPGIVTVLDSGFTDDGRPFLVTPLFRRGTYADLVSNEGPLVWQEAADVMSRVAGAVAAVHDAGLLHRDIKPANIFIGAHDSGPVLSDFGVSSRADPLRTASENPALTILYAAPEILDAERASPASDIYALGATFYALVNGAPAYWHDSVAETMRSKLDAAIPPVVTGQVLPESVAAYIGRLMSRDPSKRPATAAQVVEDLGDLASRGTDAVTTNRYQARTAELLAAGELTTPVDRLENRPPLRSPLGPEEPTAPATVNEASGRTGVVASLGARLGRFRLIAGVVAALTVGGALIGVGYLINAGGESPERLASAEIQAVQTALQEESTASSLSADAPEGGEDNEFGNESVEADAESGKSSVDADGSATDDTSLQPLLDGATSESSSEDETASSQGSAGNEDESSEVTLPGSPTTALGSSGSTASSTSTSSTSTTTSRSTTTNSVTTSRRTTTTRPTTTAPEIDCSRWYTPAESEEVTAFDAMTTEVVAVRRAPQTDDACRRGVTLVAGTTVAVHAKRGGWSYTYNARTDDWGWLLSSSLGPVVITQPPPIDCSQWYLPNGNESVAPYEATTSGEVAVRRAPASDAACKRGVTLAAGTTVTVHAERNGWRYTYHAAADDWGWVAASAFG